MRKVCLVIVRLIGPDELCLLAGLGLVSWGFSWCWAPGSLLVPGAVLVWIALPQRTSFVRRESHESAGRT